MKLKSKLLEIDGRLREGLKLKDALRQAYDVIAEELLRGRATETTLTVDVPTEVLKTAWEFGWVSRPTYDMVKYRLERPRVVRLGESIAEQLIRRTEYEIANMRIIQVGDATLPANWWEGTWLPIFAGRIQTWRGKLMAGQQPKAERPKSYPKRAKWFRDKLIERGWGETELADFSGLTRKTIRRLLKGLPANAKTLSAAIDGLNRHGRAGRVGVNEIPEG